MSNKSLITIFAPGKLMILGEHAVVYDYPCIVSSLDKYLTVRGRKTQAAKDTFATGKIKDQSFIKNAVEIVRERYNLVEKISLATESDLGMFGLGSSAAVTVATIKLLARLFRLSLTKKELFDLSYKAVLRVQKKASGFDLAASIWGGTIYFVGETKKVEALSSTALPIIVGFSGSKGDTPKLVKKVAELKKRKAKFVEDVFKTIAKLVEQGRKAILKKDWFMVGKLMSKNHQLLVKLGVSSDKLDRMVTAAVDAGAYGAKLSGAGGGDCMIALVSSVRRKQVRNAIESIGGQVIDIIVGTGI